MAKLTVTRKELLERWSSIEQEDDDENGGISSAHPVKRRHLRQLKEKWFLDAFSFLTHLPADTHVWCGYWELMGPLLETFYNYFKEESPDSPLKILWKRISGEMRGCTLCAHQHHQAQIMYDTEYEESCVGPLLSVLNTLDEERISEHLKYLNDKIARGVYDPVNDYGEVVTVMFEVLMFPVLLDDQYLANEFDKFIEAIDDSHELAFDGHQQYPGVYALFFSQSRRVRSIGLRLAGHMGNLSISTDVDPLQNLLKKCISVLEMEGVGSTTGTSRPRLQLDRITVWLGMKTLVGFLEPPAFEEGILDRYPIFLSIVLNHISDDSVEFSHAVNCLRLLFEKLGYKLWLRATLSPGVMRNTLLGQCFHTRNEKIHKEIFDLFQPFLQSLEALQDGDHEKQRRHFLYFLLHQVPVSSNFSTLMRKKACQIALLIIIRGYKMNPPCPPSECGHMWGPSLVSSLKDVSLYNSFRQPALDLIETIIVSDASALMSIVLDGQLHPSDKPIKRLSYVDMEDEEDNLFGPHSEEKDVSCWKDFRLQHKVISQVDGSWMCVPMLWFDVLVEIDPTVLPFTFSKAVFWALSLFSLIETENSSEMSLSVRNWLANCAPEISYLLGWKIPSGSDDGGEGTESRNSIRTSTMCLPLVKAFKRFAAHYIVKMQQEELMKQWTWEPMMSNSLILFLLDPTDNTRQIGRLVLEKVANVRSLTGGLQFLCSDPSSLLALFWGLRHAFELVHLDSVLSNFRTLHHLFFIMCKLLKEGSSSALTVSQNMSDAPKFSTQGGFLKQPVFDCSPSDRNEHLSTIGPALWEKFNCLLSQVAWPAILKCLDGGKPFIDYTISQISCIRLLEVMPVVFERLPTNSGIMVQTLDNIKWLHDLADWGKSSLAVVVRYWKQTLASLLGLIKPSYSNKSASAISDIEKLISCDKVSVDEVSKHVARLSVSLVDKGSLLRKSGIQSEHSLSQGSLNRIVGSMEDSENLLLKKAKVIVLDSEPVISSAGDSVIIISDDERETDVSSSTEFSHIRSTQSTHADNRTCTNAVGKETNSDEKGKDYTAHESLLVSSEACLPLDSFDSTNNVKEKISPDRMLGTPAPLSSPIAGPNSERKEIQARDCIDNSFVLQENSILKKVSDDMLDTNKLDSFTSQAYPSSKVSGRKVDHTVTKPLKGTDEIIKEKPIKATREILKDIVQENDGDSWQFSFFKPPSRQHGLVTKPLISGPKRQVIQLASPVNKRLGSMRMNSGLKRFKPPSLDDWHKPILELDFFVTVGLASPNDTDCEKDSKLKEVPVCFKSPAEYVDIFRPLVLEEFKAQLQSSYQEISSNDEIGCGSLSVLSVERIDDFHVVRFVHDEDKSTGSKGLLENDLILLTIKPLQNSIGNVHAIGKVERREKDNKRRLNISSVKLYLQGCSRLDRVRKHLTERSKWCISRIMSITPQLREFQALSSITEIPLLPVILNPVNHPSARHGSKTPNLGSFSESLQQILKSSYNDSQLQAISHATGTFDLQNDFELTLIQGPPGTGKTRTIVAIVSGLLALSQIKNDKRSRNDGLICKNSTSSRGKISESAAVARAWQDAALARQISVEVESKKSSGSYARGRVLICAQSNAAVDELIARISSEGLYGSNGLMYKPYLVRIGNAKTIHPNSIPFFIDTLVENRLADEKKNLHEESGTCSDTLTMMRNNLEKLVDQIRYYESKRANLPEGNSGSKNPVEGHSEDDVLSDADLKEKLRRLYAEKKAMYTDLANVQAREKKASEEIRALSHKLRTTILKEAEIVVTTLSGCGGALYGVCFESASSHKFIQSSENSLFDAVVIDEAAQALEPATLIPLQLLKSTGTKCIMVGDPKQLPATVLSNIASKYSFQCSMFERLQRAGHPVIMLTHQYRMHPEICRFPSSHFYDGKLLNGDDMSSKVARFHDTRCLGPYVFFDIVDGQELRGKNAAALSMYNECEADAAVEVLRFFKKRYPSEFFGGRIGIITPYKCQLSLLRSRFSSAFGSSITSEMEFNTVDGFQGREVDILLLSTVRASGSCSETTKVSSNSIGFVADVRRMNVALTRPRHSLWIFGNTQTLRKNLSWAALVEDAKQRNSIVVGKKPYSSIIRQSTENNSGNSSSTASQLEQVERVKSTREDANKYKMKHISERKRKYIGSASEDVSFRVDGGDKDEKESLRNRRSFPLEKKVVSVEVPSSNNKARKVPSSRIGHPNEENTGKSSGHGADTGMNVRSEKHPKPPRDERFTKTIKHDKQKEEVKPGRSSSGGSSREKDEKSSNQAETLANSILKRKEQREAVDALLSSALISSKKPASLKSSSVRKVPPTKNTTFHQLKPKKPRKD